MITGIKATFTGTEKDWGLYSPAEWKVFLKHCEGYTKKAIADYVCRSPDTVRTQEASIREKSGTHSMVQAVLKAVAKGIVTLTAICLTTISLSITFIDNDDFNDIRRSPRTVRVNRTNRSFRNYLV